MNTNTVAKPVANRIGSIDFLRGLAVLGILVINIESFALPVPFGPYQFGFETTVDHSVRFWVYFLFQGKFFSIFALLFGASYCLLTDKLIANGYQDMAFTYYCRRLLWLFLFGVCHAYLLWNGDILYHYAVCGLLLLPFLRAKVHTLLACIFIFMTVLAFNTYTTTTKLQAQKTAYLQAIVTPPEQRSSAESAAVNRWERRTSIKSQSSVTRANRQTITARQGGYLANIVENARHTEVHKGKVLYTGILFRTLIMMMLGMILFRLGVFSQTRHIPYYGLFAFSLLAVSLVISYFRYDQWTYHYQQPVTQLYQALPYTFAKESLALAYVLCLNFLYQKLDWRYFRWVSNVGKIALSNYIMQSVLCALIFYGYGLGYFNQFSRAQLIPWILTIWILQTILSNGWLSRHTQGPLESLWRKLTYYGASFGDAPDSHHTRLR